MQSIFSMAMCSTRNWWSYYCRKRGKQTLKSTDIFATCTHTKGKTQCPDGILQNNKLEESSFGEAVFICLHFFTCPNMSPTTVSCFRVWGLVFIRAYSLAGSLPWSWLWLFRNVANSPFKRSAPSIRIIWQNNWFINNHQPLSFLFCIWFVKTKMLALWGFRKTTLASWGREPGIWGESRKLKLKITSVVLLELLQLPGEIPTLSVLTWNFHHSHKPHHWQKIL